MKQKIALITIILVAFLTPSLVLAHGEEDHGESYHIDIMHVMESGFHGKLDGKVVEVVLSPDATLEMDGKTIKIDELSDGDSVFVTGVKMPGNKIGAKHIKVDKDTAAKHSEQPEHKAHSMMQHKGMKDDHAEHEGHKMMGDDHSEHMKKEHQGH